MRELIQKSIELAKVSIEVASQLNSVEAVFVALVGLSAFFIIHTTIITARLTVGSLIFLIKRKIFGREAIIDSY